MYNQSITTQLHQGIEPNNTEEIVLDISGNLKQIRKWTLQGFRQQQKNIDLYLRLTRKNVSSLCQRSLSAKFKPEFTDFCKEFTKLETLYEKGITDHKAWAASMHDLAVGLDKAVHSC